MPLHNQLRGQMTRHLGPLVLLQELDKKIFCPTAFYAAKLIGSDLSLLRQPL